MANKPQVHYAQATINVAASAHADAIVVRHAADLPKALAQRQVPVVIENETISRTLERVYWWGEIRKNLGWLLIPTLIYLLLNQAVSNRYQITGEWQHDWKLHRDAGKVTLTPTKP
jgi:hypothetical protein